MLNDVLIKVFLALVTCLLLWTVWKAAKPQSVFTIRIVNGSPEPIDGKITTAFLTRIQEIAAANAISHGTINGYAHGQLIRLRFSADIPESAQQQLRNWWATFGWHAPPVGRPSCSS